MTALGDPAFFAGDCDASLARLRAAGPVQLAEQAGCWAVLGHGEVIEVSRDPGRFCSGRGVLISDRNRDVAAGDSILYLDPPRHASHRKIVNRAFTPRRVAELEPRIRALTVELLDAVDPTSVVDAVGALTAPLPLLVIAELLGLPADDRDNFRAWSDAVMAAATDLTEENALGALEMLSYLEGQLDRRSGEHSPSGGDDLLDALLNAEVDGERLSRHDQLQFCMTLLVAGNETTRALMSGGLVALAEAPEQRSALAADGSTIVAAVEEMLRWVTPIMAMARTATTATTLAETPIDEGDYVVMVYGAANRDEAVFGADAGVFDVSRTANPHVSFGFGEHFCIGAPLARLETRILFEEVLGRWPAYEVAGPVERAPSTLLRQITHLPIRFAP
ncbi:MAG: cytochrome P450 [Acidimicrobiales bacterium]